jgi:hypothetical protein
LADALDISIEELKEAQKEARDNGILQAVEAGYISQNEADHIFAFIALREAIDRREIVASVLGIGVEDLERAIEDGERIEDLIDDLGLGPVEIRARFREAFETAVQSAVENGDITDEQAEIILNFNNPGRFLNRNQRFGPERPHGFRTNRRPHGFQR